MNRIIFQTVENYQTVLGPGFWIIEQYTDRGLRKVKESSTRQSSYPKPSDSRIKKLIQK